MAQLALKTHCQPQDDRQSLSTRTVLLRIKQMKHDILTKSVAVVLVAIAGFCVWEFRTIQLPDVYRVEGIRVLFVVPDCGADGSKLSNAGKDHASPKWGVSLQMSLKYFSDDQSRKGMALLTAPVPPGLRGCIDTTLHVNVYCFKDSRAVDVSDELRLDTSRSGSDKAGPPGSRDERPATTIGGLVRDIIQQKKYTTGPSLDNRKLCYLGNDDSLDMSLQNCDSVVVDVVLSSGKRREVLYRPAPIR